MYIFRDARKDGRTDARHGERRDARMRYWPATYMGSKQYMFVARDQNGSEYPERKRYPTNRGGQHAGDDDTGSREGHESALER